MLTTKRIIAGAVAAAALVAAPVAVAAPAFASSKENVMAAAAEHDAQQSLAHANRSAQFGMAHAQQEKLHVDQTGRMIFNDDGGHHFSFDRQTGKH